MAREYEDLQDGINLFSLAKINTDMRYLFNGYQSLEAFLNGVEVVKRAMLEKGIISTEYIANGSVYGIKVADGTLEGRHIRDGSLVSENFGPEVIKRWMLEPGIISTLYLSDGSIYGSKLADGSVYGSKVADEGIERKHLQLGIISTQYLADGSVYGSKISPKSISTDKIADEGVKTPNIGQRSVTEDKLATTIKDKFNNFDNSITDLSNTVNNLTLESGNSDMEVVQARGGYTVLDERLDKEKESYIKNFEGVGNITTNKKGLYSKTSTKGTLVILDDDTRTTSYDVLYQYAKANSIPITLAANSSHILDPASNRINIDQFLEMKDDPLVEFVNHTHTHARLTELTSEQIHEEIRLCEEFLNGHGIYTKHLVYPFGAINEEVKKIASEYVYSASKSSGRIVDPQDAVLDSMQIDRVNFETELSVLQTRMNDAAAVGGCVLINSHSQYETFSTEKLGQIVDMARASGLDVVNYSEAFKRFGNMLELRDETGALVGGVSASGHAEGIFKKNDEYIKYILSDGYALDTPPSQYINNMITGFNITNKYATDNNWPTAGRLYTYRSGPDDYTFQLLHPINSNRVLKRYWNTNGTGWSAFAYIDEKPKLTTLRGPYTLIPGGYQNITVNDTKVKKGDVVAYTIDTPLNNETILTGPIIESDGIIKFRINNMSVSNTYEIPAFNIYTKIL